MIRCTIYTIVIILALGCFTASAKKGYGPGEQDWGYVDVRDGAHMFYWLYYTTSEEAGHYTSRPLAIWLQGGPGASSTGYGNFEELGPLDLYGNPRNFTWVKDMNVLFIDNPVGSGFSYVDSITKYTTTNYQIATDLVSFMKGFYKLHPEFVTVPLHIFCESYGGKMAPEFALELYYAIERGEIRSNFKSVALGDPWTSPIDSVLAWAPLLFEMGVVDRDGYEKIQDAALETERLVNDGKWTQATNQWSNTQRVVLRESKGVDFYNIEKPTNAEAYPRILKQNDNYDLMIRTMVNYNYNYDIDEDRDQILEDLMLGPVSEALGIPANVKWGTQGGTTFLRLMGDFMKPVIHIVSELLTKTPIKVGVFSGQLDLICATPGTVNWISKLEYGYKDDYHNASRVAINVNRILEGYERSSGNFSMFWVNRAGHMVPADNPAAMDHILRKFTKYDIGTREELHTFF